jgi:hypothetical protein
LLGVEKALTARVCCQQQKKMSYLCHDEFNAFDDEEEGAGACRGDYYKEAVFVNNLFWLP